MIENILPQLQDEANHILNSLTGSQLSVQFLTQKPKASRSKKSSSQYIDTLEIIISDAQGTRSYETYSGGKPSVSILPFALLYPVFSPKEQVLVYNY